ncbi:MAG: DUF1501 domain-containing protein [Gemmataceae bacterium]|nr:DUF1501 domain-containing protein [Gemmataceae bacterium]MCI0738631.1 DUF1501 domain-containing protein [Gemmataceae bacterium]
MAPLFTRRQMLWSLGGGLGGIALADLLAREQVLAGEERARNVNGLHHPAKARRVIQLFMNGGVSQMDTFDYKPLLERYHGRPFDPGTGERIEAVTSVPGNVLRNPFPFRQHGQCGRWVSSVFPQLARRVDDIAFLLAVASKTNVHGPASYMMNTGFLLPGFPCMGAWLSYGLGSLSDNLPTFVVIPDHRGTPYNNLGNFSSGFLPVQHAGTVLRVNAPNPISSLFPPQNARHITRESEADGLNLLRELNREHLERTPGDSRLEARIASYELAARMQASAPEALDVNRETEATRRLYGLDQAHTQQFGRSCLIARRMIERGVRFVQVWSGAGGPTNNWDMHTSIVNELPGMAAQVDQPIAGLLQDLKQRGLFEDTLVVFSTEFGRHPFSQGSEGRDHNGGTGVAWLAGAGIKGGTAYGESDDWSWRAIDPLYCYDVHATILHLLGIDHTRLTFRHNGTDRRLTDVHGHVVDEILA